MVMVMVVVKRRIKEEKKKVIEKLLDACTVTIVCPRRSSYH